jgi:hypothetical protein
MVGAGVEDDHSGPQPGCVEVGSDIGRHQDRIWGSGVRSGFDGDLAGLGQTVEVALGAARAAVFGEKPIEERFPLGPPIAIFLRDQIQIAQSSEHL